MANYCAKGGEYMRELGRRGGLKSGEKRRLDRVGLMLGFSALDRGDSTLLLGEAIQQLARAEKRPNRSGGSHETDWRCPECGHFSSIQNRACAKCRMPGPQNGRWTKKRLRERRAERRIAAILDKHGP